MICQRKPIYVWQHVIALGGHGPLPENEICSMGQGCAPLAPS